MTDHRGAFDPESLEELADMAGLRPDRQVGAGGAIALAVAEEVGRDHPRPRGKERNIVPPHVGGGGEPVQKQGWRAVAGVDVGQLTG